MAAEFELAGYGGHGSPAQAAALVGAPNYPNSIKWSEQNLIAVASGHLVTILSPAALTGPRGIVPISQNPLFDIGTVKREDLLSPELTEFRLSREGRACVRSLDWSPLGLASNGGCLLAVCTTQSLVKLYRAPFCDYTPEWVEVADLTELMYTRSVENEFKKADVPSPVFAGTWGLEAGSRADFSPLDGANLSNVSLGVSPNKRRVLIQEPQHRKVQRTKKIESEEQDRVDEIIDGDTFDEDIGAANTSEGSLSPTNLFERLSAGVKEDLGMTHQGNTLQNQAENVVHDLVEVPLHGGNEEESPTLGLTNGNLRIFTPGLPTKKSRKAKNIPDVTDSSKTLKSDLDANAQSSQNVLPANYRAQSYALSALVVAWSQKIHMDGRVFVLCAVGTKAGSFWLFRVGSPEVYSVERTFAPHICLLGEVPAHGAWITSLSWGLISSVGHTSGDTMVLATGADDGRCLPLSVSLHMVVGTNSTEDSGRVSLPSGPWPEGSPFLIPSLGMFVKLWSGNSQILALLPPNLETVPFTLLRQVVDADVMLVSSLAITVTTGASSRMMLAVGKGSGHISTWEFDTSWSIIRMASQPRAHDQVVTGLTWTTNGHCLYSCGQDNLLQVWSFLEDQLSVLPLPTCSAFLSPNIPQMSIDLPASVLDPYYGVALSPGNLSMAVVRGIAVDMIDQMYQARTQKGVVHLFWVGGQKTKSLSSSRHQGLEDPFAKSISSDILTNWSSRFLSTLHQMENHSQPLVLWDVLAALFSLKKLVGKDYVTSVVRSWLSSWCKGINSQTNDSSFISSDHLKVNLPDASTRQLQILCVLYRQLLLAQCNAELLSGRTSIESMDPAREKRRQKAGIPECSLPAEDGVSKTHLHFVEHELRQRVFLGILYSTGSMEPTEQEKESCGDWDLATVLIVDWVLANSTEYLPELVRLAKRIHISLVAKQPLSGEQLLLERCTFCDASVPLESLDVAHCRGVEAKKGKFSHRLQRCSVTLQVCPGSPLWHCSCCARWASTLAPASFFSLSSRTYPEEVPTPPIQQPTQVVCPFCGVLMHRYLPDFLLTSSAV